MKNGQIEPIPDPNPNALAAGGILDTSYVKKIVKRENRVILIVGPKGANGLKAMESEEDITLDLRGLTQPLGTIEATIMINGAPVDCRFNAEVI